MSVYDDLYGDSPQKSAFRDLLAGRGFGGGFDFGGAGLGGSPLPPGGFSAGGPRLPFPGDPYDNLDLATGELTRRGWPAPDAATDDLKATINAIESSSVAPVLPPLPKPGLLSRGAAAVGTVLGAPGEAVDWLARKVGAAEGLNLEGMTRGEMLRAAAGLDPSGAENQTYGRRLAGKAIEEVGSLATDPVALALTLGGGVPGVAGAGKVLAPLFTGQMALGAVEGAGNVAQEVKQHGFTPQAAEELLGTGIAGGFAALGAKHMLKARGAAAEAKAGEPATQGLPPAEVAPPEAAAGPVLPPIWEGQPPAEFRPQPFAGVGEAPLKLPPEQPAMVLPPLEAPQERAATPQVQQAVQAPQVLPEPPAEAPTLPLPPSPAQFATAPAPREATPPAPPAAPAAPASPLLMAEAAQRLRDRGVATGESVTKILVDELGIPPKKALQWAERMQRTGITPVPRPAPSVLVPPEAKLPPQAPNILAIRDIPSPVHRDLATQLAERYAEDYFRTGRAPDYALKETVDAAGLGQYHDAIHADAAHRAGSRFGGRDYVEQLRQHYGDSGPEGISVYETQGRTVVVQRHNGEVVGGGEGFTNRDLHDQILMVTGGPKIGSPVSARPVYEKLTELGYKPSDVLSPYGEEAQVRQRARAAQAQRLEAVSGGLPEAPGAAGTVGAGPVPEAGLPAVPRGAAADLRPGEPGAGPGPAPEAAIPAAVGEPAGQPAGPVARVAEAAAGEPAAGAGAAGELAPGQPAPATVPRETPTAPAGAAPAPRPKTPLDLNRTRLAFPGLEFRPDPASPGEFTTRLRDGSTLRVNQRGDIVVHPEEVGNLAASQVIGGEGSPRGVTRTIGRDKIVTVVEPDTTLDHEAYHFFRDRALSEPEKAAAAKKYGTEEAEAYAYEEWKKGGKGGRQEANSWFEHILAYAKRVVHYFRPTWESTFEEVASGRAGERVAGAGEPAAPAVPAVAGGTRFATQPVEPEPAPERPEPKPIRVAELTPEDRLRALGWSQPEISRLSPDARQSAAANAQRPPALGRTMKEAGVEPPRVAQAVSEFEAVKSALPPRQQSLSRDAPRTWESLDPEIRDLANRVLAPHEITSGPRKGQPMTAEEAEKNFLDRARSGKISDVENQLLEVIKKSKSEAMERVKAQLDQATAEGRDTGPDNTAFLQAAFQAARADMAIASRTSVEARTKLARALAASARVMNSLGVSTPDRFIQKVFREIPGISDKQALDLYDVFKSNPEKLPDMLTAAMRPTLLDKILFIWKSGLVSAPGTQIANLTGNTLEQGLRAGETGIAPFWDHILGGEHTRSFAELPREIRGLAFGFKEGLHTVGDNKGLGEALMDALKLKPEEINPNAPLEYQVNPVEGAKGRFVAIPFRFLQAFDNYFRVAGHWAERYKLAERLSGGDLAKRAELLQHPTDDMVKEIEAQTAARVYQEPNQVVHAVDDLRSKLPLTHILIPFNRTPMNILWRAIQRSPIGFVKAAGEHADWKRAIREGKPPEEVTALREKAIDSYSRATLGTAAVMMFYGLAKSGGLTGSGPTDPKARALLRETGWQPYSMRFPGEVFGKPGKDVFIPFNRFEPASSLIGVAADLAETENLQKQGDILSKLGGSVIQNLTNKTFMQGLAQAAQAYNDPQRMFSGYVSQLAGSAIPNIVRRTAQAIDPTVREVKPEDAGLPGLGEQIRKSVQAGIPFASEALTARRSGTGEVVRRPGYGEGVAGAAMRFALPVQATESRPGADLEQTLVDIGYPHTSPSRDMAVPGSRGRHVQLSDAEMGMLSDADKQASNYLRGIVANPQFKAMDPEMQKRFIERVFSDYRTAARMGLYQTPGFQTKAREAMRAGAAAGVGVGR